MAAGAGLGSPHAITNMQYSTDPTVTTGAPAPKQHKLTREEVAIKYAPKPDPNWTPEREAAFFRSLPKGSASRAGGSCPLWLINDFAREVLGAKRISAGHTATLKALLHVFAEADSWGTEVRISQRMEQYGSPQSIRTIQAQMHKAGLLRKVKREQGSGFVGTVYVYAPKSATWADYEEALRMRDGEADYPDQALLATGITEVPF